jgi:adenine deaminase
VISSGVEPLEALRLATLNPALYFGLSDRGGLAPGRRADLLVLSVADGDTVIAGLTLAVGGLMSELPIEDIRDRLEAVLAASHELGTPLHDPFMAMSFLGLEVISALKITDQGLVDVEQFTPVELWV